MSSALETVVLFITIFMGYSAKILGFRTSFRKCIEKPISYFTKLIYFVLLPLLFLFVFAERGLSLADFSVLSVALLYVFISLAILWILIRENDERVKKAMVLTTIFQNTIYLGFPVIMVLYGNIKYAAMYSLVTTVMHLTVGGILGGSRNIARTIASIPVIYGFVFGNIIHYTIYYSLFTPLLSIRPYVSIIVAYGSAFIMGYSLPQELHGVLNYMKYICFTSLYRITISPIIHVMLMYVFRLPTDAFYQILVEAFMPPALTNIIIARIYGWNRELVSAVTLISTFISVPTVFLLYWIGILVP